MKTTLIRALILMLALVPHLYASAANYNFESDGLYYNILSEEERTIEVAQPIGLAHGNCVQGDLEVPREVVYESNTYTVTSIGKQAFWNCSGLTSVTIPNSVESIGVRAFSNCTALISVAIPNSLTSIGNDAFLGCPTLETFSVAPENATFSSIDGILYNNDASTLLRCPGGKTAVTIPASVTSIGNGAFTQCKSLTSVTMPNSVTSIGDYAFSFCI